MRRAAVFTNGVLLALLLLALAPSATAKSKGRRPSAKPKAPAAKVTERFSGQVVRVSDGDSFYMEAGGRSVRVRIYGVDAPELSQEFGQEARKYLDTRIYRSSVVIEKFYDDQYGRCVGRVLVDSQDIALELLREGIVWHYVYFCDDPAYAEAEKAARAAKKGLWKNSAAIPPWEYRKGHPRK